MSYTLEEEKELNQQLSMYQSKFKRFINGEKWDSIAERLSPSIMSIITLIMNATSYKDVNWLVMRNAQYALQCVREESKRIR